MKKDIRQITLLELQSFLKENNEKPFRAQQILDWLWKKSAKSFEEMSNISVSLRNLLNENFSFDTVQIHTTQISNDGTIKVAFKLADGNLVEGVLIPATDRMTACVSSQVGCSLTCKFCATGYMTRKRNLLPSEIYDQVVQIDALAKQHYQMPLTNIVYMGMGEPLLNYANVMKSVELITSPAGLNMSYKRITVSTAGIAKMIVKLAEDGAKFNLALSLHAANDDKRNEIMPINDSNSLENLADALKEYYHITKNPVTYEYIVFKDVNDTLQDAQELYQFTKHVPCKVNIIEYNPIQEADYQNTSEENLYKFQRYLEKKDVNVHVRRSRGKDIDAACGQLAIKEVIS